MQGKRRTGTDKSAPDEDWDRRIRAGDGWAPAPARAFDSLRARASASRELPVDQSEEVLLVYGVVSDAVENVLLRGYQLILAYPL